MNHFVTFLYFYDRLHLHDRICNVFPIPMSISLQKHIIYVISFLPPESIFHDHGQEDIRYAVPFLLSNLLQ